VGFTHESILTSSALASITLYSSTAVRVAYLLQSLLLKLQNLIRRHHIPRHTISPTRSSDFPSTTAEPLTGIPVLADWRSASREND
jgi:hypothetical protein